MTEKRNLIADKLIATVKAIRSGATVDTNRSYQYTYKHTPGLVTDSLVEIMNLSDANFPVVFFRFDGPTILSEPKERSYSATWQVGIELSFKNFDKPDQFDSTMRTKLEELWRDIEVSLHVDEHLGQSTDVNLIFRKFEPEVYANPDIGTALIDLDIDYNHLSFGP